MGRLISSGGNVYSLTSEPAKRGVSTTGRGHWAGKKPKDDDNPDVDSPSFEGAVEYIRATEEEDAAFEDDLSPEDAMARVGVNKNALRHEMKQAKDIVEAASGTLIGKSVLTLRSLKMDLLLQNPEDLTEEQLLQSAQLVKSVIETSSTAEEARILTDYAERVANALRSTIEAKRAVVKAILTKPSEEREKTKKTKPNKAKEKTVNDKGKIAYKYQKKGDGKGPNSDIGTGAPQADPQAPPPEDPQAAPVTPPPPTDPKPFADLINVSVEQIKKFAGKHTRKDFIAFFMKRPDFISANHLTAGYFSSLYDALSSPPPSAQPPGGQPLMPFMQPPQAQAPAQQPQLGQPPMGKSTVVVFTGATLNAETLAMVDLLKSYKAETVEDIRKCLQQYCACDELESARRTVSLLNKWEREGLVSLYPAKVIRS